MCLIRGHAGFPVTSSRVSNQEYGGYMRTRARIIGTGSYLPPKVVQERRPQAVDGHLGRVDSSAGPGSGSGVTPNPGFTPRIWPWKPAGRPSRNAGITPRDIECIILATLSPDMFFPGTAVFLQDKLGIAEGGLRLLRHPAAVLGFRLRLRDGQVLHRGRHLPHRPRGRVREPLSGLDFSTRGRAVTVLFGTGPAPRFFRRWRRSGGRGALLHRGHADGRGALNGIHMGVYDISHKPLIDYDALDFDQNEYLWPKMASPRGLFTNG